MIRSIFRRLAAVSVLIFASPLAFAAGQNCVAMEADGPQWFAAQLDKVRNTYESGSSQEAYRQLWKAMMSLPRSADVSLDARCVGPAEWQRMYELRQAITHTLGKQSENLGKLANTEGALDWYVRGDNRDDARRVIKQLTPTAEGTAFIISRLRSEISLLDRAEESGFELLPEERSSRGFWRTDLNDTIEYARKQGAGSLDKEAGLLTRAATANEEQFEQAQENQKTLIADFLGDESLAVQNEVQREVNRAEASLTMLGSARDWLQAISIADAESVRDRALVRGDALLAQGADTGLSLEARDSLFEAADNYFEFAENSQRRQAADEGRAAIAPALKAERDARAARLDKKKAELQKSAEQMQQSIQKTDTQKKSFKDEADAMEAELGF